MRKYLPLMTLAVLAAVSAAKASPLFPVPPGLVAGDIYRLVFTTFDTTDATSTSIATYNLFVTTEANASAALLTLGATWTVIGSTATTNAIGNIGTPAGPVYNLGGTEVATSTSNMFGNPLLAKINVDQFGNVVATNTVIWTGSHAATGNGEVGHQLGTSAPEVGQVNTGAGWLTNSQITSNTDLHPVYAMSSLLTVAPEPQSLGLAGAGVVALLLGARARRRA
jgi:hypothetical protein